MGTCNRLENCRGAWDALWANPSHTDPNADQNPTATLNTKQYISLTRNKNQTVTYLKRLDVGFAPWRPGMNPGWQVRFVVDGVDLEQVFLRKSGLLINNPPLLHIHLSSPQEMCDSPDKAAYVWSYPGSKLGTASLNQLLAGIGEKVV
jgi:hypothetical protein